MGGVKSPFAGKAAVKRGRTELVPALPSVSRLAEFFSATV